MKRIKAIIATAIAVPALAAGVVLSGTASGLSAAPAAPASHAKLVDFSGGFETDNQKVEGFDHGCLTFAHPVAGSAIGTAPCDGGHNWDIFMSPDGTQVVLRAHGTQLALADSGGNIVLEPANKTSDSLKVLEPGVVDGNGTVFLPLSFDENQAVWIMATGITGNVIASRTLNVHDAWLP